MPMPNLRSRAVLFLMDCDSFDELPQNFGLIDRMRLAQPHRYLCIEKGIVEVVAAYSEDSLADLARKMTTSLTIAVDRDCYDLDSFDGDAVQPVIWLYAFTNDNNEPSIPTKPAGFLIDVPVTLTVAIRGQNLTEDAALAAAGAFAKQHVQRIADDNHCAGWHMWNDVTVTEISLEATSKEASEVIDTLAAE